MPLLNCTARTCVYNKDEYCSKGDIKIDGNDAKTADETCCKSFVERKEGVSNSASEGCGCQNVQILCEACQCAYNHDEKCEAAKITVTGTGACKCGDTKCGTFCKG